MTPPAREPGKESELRRQVTATRSAYLAAAEQLEQTCRRLQSEGRPQLFVELEQLSRRQRHAFENYDRALQAFCDFLSSEEDASSAAARRALKPHVTQREREILDKLAAGMTSREVARELKITFKTAVTHRSNLLQKFDANNIAVLVRRAILHGFVKP